MTHKFSTASGEETTGVNLTYPVGGGWYNITVSVPGNALVQEGGFELAGLPFQSDYSVSHISASDFQARGAVFDNTTAVSGSVALRTSARQFADMREIPAGDTPYGVAAGDVNNDGRDDVVVTAQGPMTVGVLLQAPAGDLAAPVNYSVREAGTAFRPQRVAIGDLNGDGRKDVAVTYFKGWDGNLAALTGGAGVFYQTAGGTLAAMAWLDVVNATNKNPEGLAIGDVNGDGRNDLAIVYQWSGTVAVHYQQAGGTLAPPVPMQLNGVLPQPTDVTVADFNGDTWLDLAVAHYIANGSVLFLQDATTHNLGTQQFLNAQSGYPYDICGGDVNGDGKTDIAMANSDTTYGGGGTISIFIQNQSGLFNAVRKYPAAAGSKGIACGDVTGDGKADVVVSNEKDAGAGLGVFPQNATGALAAMVGYISGASPTDAALGDLNGDGLMDAVTANGGSGSIGVFYQRLPTLSGNYTSPPASFPPQSFSPLKILTATPVWNTTPAGAPPLVYLSNDDGATWTAAAGGTLITFSTVGSILRYRVFLNSSSTLDDIFIAVTTEEYYPSGIEVDVGGDGSVEWRNAPRLEASAAVQSPSIADAFNRFVRQATGTAAVDVLVSIHSATAGVLNVRGLSVRYNQPPVEETASPPVTPYYLDEGKSALFRIYGKDPDNDTLLYKWYLDGALKSSQNESYGFATTYTDAGEYNLTVAVSDGLFSFNHTWTVVVRNVNRPPALADRSPSAPSVTVSEGKSVQLSITVTDPDSTGVDVDWKLDGGKVKSEARVNGSTFTFLPKYGDAGTHNLTAEFGDGEAPDAQVSWTVTVVAVDPLTAFDLLSPKSDSTMNEGETMIFSVDADGLAGIFPGATLSYSWFVNNTLRSANSSFTLTTDYNSPSWLQVRLVVKAGNLTFVHQWRVDITNVNDPPAITALEPSPSNPVVLREGTRLEFRVAFTDPDGAGTVSVSWKLDGKEVSTGNTFVYAPDYRSAGGHIVTLTLNDGFVTIGKQWNVTVQDAVQPAISSGPPAALIAGILVAVIVAAVVGVLFVRSRKERLADALVRAESRLSGPDTAPAQTIPAPPAGQTVIIAPPPKPTKPCPSCDRPVHEDWFLCHHCSVPLVAAGQEEIAAEEAAVEEVAEEETPPAAQEEATAQAGTTACPGCGEPVDAEWQFCPSCNAPLKPAPVPEEAVPAPAPPPSTPQEPTQEDASKAILDAERVLRSAKEKGADVSRAEITLRVAASFLRTKNYGKACKYAGKARGAVEGE